MVRVVASYNGRAGDYKKYIIGKLEAEKTSAIKNAITKIMEEENLTLQQAQTKVFIQINRD